MTSMDPQLLDIAGKARESLSHAQDTHALEEWRKQYIGRSGEVSSLLREVKNLPDDQKRAVGSEANALKRELEELYAEKLHMLSGAQKAESVKAKSYKPARRIGGPER